MAARQGLRHQLLDGAPCPAELLHVWQWFRELDRARGSNGFGANPISFAEIAAWAQLGGHHLRPFELALIMKLDAVALEHLARQEQHNG